MLHILACQLVSQLWRKPATYHTRASQATHSSWQWPGTPNEQYWKQKLQMQMSAAALVRLCCWQLWSWRNTAVRLQVGSQYTSVTQSYQQDRNPLCTVYEPAQDSWCMQRLCSPYLGTIIIVAYGQMSQSWCWQPHIMVKSLEYNSSIHKYKHCLPSNVTCTWWQTVSSVCIYIINTHPPCATPPPQCHFYYV